MHHHFLFSTGLHTHPYVCWCWCWSARLLSSWIEAEDQQKEVHLQKEGTDLQSRVLLREWDTIVSRRHRHRYLPTDCYLYVQCERSLKSMTLSVNLVLEPCGLYILVDIFWNKKIYLCFVGLLYSSSNEGLNRPVTGRLVFSYCRGFLVQEFGFVVSELHYFM